MPAHQDGEVRQWIIARTINLKDYKLVNVLSLSLSTRPVYYMQCYNFQQLDKLICHCFVPHLLIEPEDEATALVSQATPLRRERKGLVTLRPSSCRHDRNLSGPIRSALFVVRIRCHGVQLRHNVFSGCSSLLPNRNGQ